MILRRAWRLKRGTKDADLNLVQVFGICTKIGVRLILQNARPKLEKRRGPNQRSDVPFTQVVSPALHAVGFGAKLQLGSISNGVSSYHINKAINCRLA